MFKIFQILAGMSSHIFTNFLALFGRKYAVGTASVLAYLATTAAMIVCLKSILLSIVALITIPSWIYSAIAMFIPSNAVGIMSGILSAKICKEAYFVATNKIKLLNNAS